MPMMWIFTRQSVSRRVVGRIKLASPLEHAAHPIFAMRASKVDFTEAAETCSEVVATEPLVLRRAVQPNVSEAGIGRQGACGSK
jgi:hypothetical protein